MEAGGAGLFVSVGGELAKLEQQVVFIVKASQETLRARATRSEARAKVHP